MNASNNIVVLMTACIRPNGMINTKLQDYSVRKSQYIDAINYYLNSTNFKIVFCENSGIDIYNDIDNIKKFNRLECITFFGNNKVINKSHGEIEIILYSINNSQYIKNNTFIIKVTGRVKVLNLRRYFSNNILNKNNEKFFIEFPTLYSTNTVCFGANVKNLLDCLKGYRRQTLIENYDIEKIIALYIHSNIEMKVKAFFPYIVGICGTTNLPYLNKNIIYRKLLHYNAITLINSNNLRIRKSLIALYYKLYIKLYHFIRPYFRKIVN